MKRESLLIVTLGRAMHDRDGRSGQEISDLVASGERLSRWEASRLAVSAAPRAVRVAGFIVMWALALDELGGEVGIEAFADWSAGSRSTVYRSQADFRELFPEYDSPTALAEQLLEVARKRGESVSVGLPVAV